MNAALKIVVALGAYCPRVTITDPEQLAKQIAAGKRRKRPLTGRGGYGKSLMAHFDRQRSANKAA